MLEAALVVPVLAQDFVDFRKQDDLRLAVVVSLVSFDQRLACRGLVFLDQWGVIGPF